MAPIPTLTTPDPDDWFGYGAYADALWSRVICAIHYDRQKIYIREVFTHAEYDRWSKTYRSKRP